MFFSRKKQKFFVWGTQYSALFIVTAITIISLIGFLAKYWWVGELLSQLRPQYAFALTLCLPIVVWRFGRTGWLFLIPLLFNVATFAPLYFHTQTTQKPTTQTISVLHYNLDNTLSSHTIAFAYLRSHPVDILSLQELTPEEADRLHEELPDYQIAYSHPMNNSHGSAVLLGTGSDIQVQTAEVIHLPDYSVRPIIAITLNIQGHSIAFLSFHAIRPVSAWNTDFQKIEFGAAAEWSRHQQNQGQAVFMIGDFNSTSWSANFHQLQQDGQLLNSEQGFGLQPTWPIGLPIVFTIPIDHCLHSQEVMITDRFAGPYLGSDHAPLHVQFSINDSPP
ncbi:MAG: endonuclease/exonuclease/phosphatase family protein [Anaerolineales bacterium]|nr:endonuclease/exonuclease/phosphatase family protein [Anaerolineales bacterium]